MLKFIKKILKTQVISCEYCKIFKKTFFIEHLSWLLLLMQILASCNHEIKFISEGMKYRVSWHVLDAAYLIHQMFLTISLRETLLLQIFSSYYRTTMKLRKSFSVFWYTSFNFDGIQTIAPEQNCPPVRVMVRISFRVGGHFSLGTIILEPIYFTMFTLLLTWTCC